MASAEPEPKADLQATTEVLIHDTCNAETFHASLAGPITACGTSHGATRTTIDEARTRGLMPCKECFGGKRPSFRDCQALDEYTESRLRVRSVAELRESRHHACRRCFPDGVPDDLEEGAYLSGHEINAWHRLPGGDD